MKPLRTITFNGECLTVPEWAIRLDLTKNTIYKRMRYDWSLEEVMTIKERGKKADLRVWRQRVDSAVECVQEMMLARGYFRKETRIRAYKQLKRDYEYFKAQDRMKIAV